MADDSFRGVDEVGGKVEGGVGGARLRPHYGTLHWMVLSVLLAAFGWFYVWVAERLVLQTNLEVELHGQVEQMDAALEAREGRAADPESEGLSGMVQQWVPHQTDGLNNPLWPWLVSWVAPEGLEAGYDFESGESEEFFRLGKWLNVALTGALLLSLGMVCGRTFTLLGTINLVAIAGLGGLLPAVVLFAADALFSVFFLLSWICCLAILKKNSLWLYAVLGLVLGLAYLSKSSVVPLLGVFLIVTTYRFFSALFPWLLGTGSQERGRACEWSCQNHFVGLVFLVFAFVMTAGPRLAHANEVFDNPAHDYANTMRWADTAEEAREWKEEHGSKESLVELSEEDRPSLKLYLKEHSGAEIQARISEGVEAVVVEFLDLPNFGGEEEEEVKVEVAGGEPEPWQQVLPWRGLYLGVLCGVLLLVVLLFPLHRKRAVFPSQRIEVGALPISVFVGLTVVAYAVAYGWYRPIESAEGLMLVLYAPLVFSVVAGAESLLLRVRRRGEHLWMLKLYAVLQLVVSAGLVWRVVEIALNPSFAG
ncbi:MAG: hypothetical protein P8J87_15180 [Verrucomicrobiales bacterium]|nr:hypothetical protein [Verrucomicrobiales bacterium]